MSGGPEPVQCRAIGLSASCTGRSLRVRGCGKSGCLCPHWALGLVFQESDCHDLLHQDPPKGDTRPRPLTCVIVGRN